MAPSETHDSLSSFQRLNASDGVPAPSPDCIDVALLEAGSSGPCAAIDALLDAVGVEIEALSRELDSRGRRVRMIRFDLTGRMDVPQPGRFRLHLAAGEPAPDARSAGPMMGETALARLLDAVVTDRESAMLATGEAFDLVCRWAAVGTTRPRPERSLGAIVNRLSREAMQHPWFGQFARELPDHQHFQAFDDCWTETILEDAGKAIPIAFEASGPSALTMIEIARDRDGVMPRFLATRHHPQLTPSNDHPLERLTAQYTLIEPLRFHLRRLL